MLPQGIPSFLESIESAFYRHGQMISMQTINMVRSELSSGKSSPSEVLVRPEDRQKRAGVCIGSSDCVPERCKGTGTHPSPNKEWKGLYSLDQECFCRCRHFFSSGPLAWVKCEGQHLVHIRRHERARKEMRTIRKSEHQHLEVMCNPPVARTQRGS